MKEPIYLDWDAIILNLTYQVIEDAVVEYGEPPLGIPKLQFVQIVLAQNNLNGKSYLIKE